MVCLLNNILENSIELMKIDQTRNFCNKFLITLVRIQSILSDCSVENISPIYKEASKKTLWDYRGMGSMAV